LFLDTPEVSSTSSAPEEVIAGTPGLARVVTVAMASAMKEAAGVGA
jgi:hypothetical protein